MKQFDSRFAWGMTNVAISLLAMFVGALWGKCSKLERDIQSMKAEVRVTAELTSHGGE